MGPSQPPSRAKTFGGSKLESKTKHRLSTSVSDVPYSPEELSSGGSSKSGSRSSSLKDILFKRRARSSLGGTEDLVHELDKLESSGNPATALSAVTAPARPRPFSMADGGANNSQDLPAYPALRAQPTEPDDDLEAASAFSDKESPTSGQNNLSSNQGIPEESSLGHAVNHPDVVDLETKGGSAVQLKAGAYSTNEDKDLWICRQCGWTYPNANPSAKERRSHKKVCQKLYTGVEVPPGSSEDASSGDELQAEDAEQVSKTASSAAKDEPEASPKTFVKPTISTGSDSAKSSPTSSPGNQGSPFTSPAKRDPRLPPPAARKETPWGSPIRRSTTPGNSPSGNSRKTASPVTSPVKRILSTPVKRDSPPRPENQGQGGLARSYTSKEQQEEEERKISVKKRIQELERITSSKTPTWAGKSGELSSSGSPLKHGDDDRRKSVEISPSGKLLKPIPPGGRRSLDFSPGTASGKPAKHTRSSSQKSGELSTPSLSADEKASTSSQVGTAAAAPSVGQTSSQAEAAPAPPEASSAAVDGKVVAPVVETEKVKDGVLPDKEVDEPADVTIRTEEKGPVTAEEVAAVSPFGTSIAELLSAAADVISPATELQADGNTAPTSQKLEEASESVYPDTAGEVGKSGVEAVAHTRNSSVSSDKGEVLSRSVEQPVDPIVAPDDAQTKVGVSEDSNVDKSIVIDSPLTAEDAEPAKEAEDRTSSAEGPGPVVENSVRVDESSSAVDAPVSKEEPVQPNAPSTQAATSDVTPSVESEEESPEVVASEPVKEPSSDVSTVSSRSFRIPETDNSAGDVSPSARPVDEDDENSLLLKKQPAVDPLFVESQQDRLWEMHSQELTRRDGEASGADVRESSAQDDDPARYANGSPLTPDATSSGAKSNGNGTSEKGGKVDRPRTPLRNLIAEDDAADKGDEGAPTGKETPIVSPRGNLFKRIVSGGKSSPTKPSTPVGYEKKSHTSSFLTSCICCSPVK
ncbi:hypothetical protein R1sor_023467 [Riccia sorocarpa]|uniref:Uncharacterized protein n=1 Tax=Riccia sorocarpa TaxID=122646 RepID=A0ABD3GPA0_9MARC